MADLATVDTQDLAPLLAQHEAVIERGLQSFVEVGEALAAIRDQRLYRAAYRNFDAYLAERWPELGHRNYVGKIIRAARVAEELGTTVPTARPATEGQVRPLLVLKTPEDRRAAWERAAEQARAAGRAAPTGREVEVATDTVKRERATERAEAQRQEALQRPLPAGIRVCLAHDQVWPHPHRWLNAEVSRARLLISALDGSHPNSPSVDPLRWLHRRATPAEFSVYPEVLTAAEELWAVVEEVRAFAIARLRDAISGAEQVVSTTPDEPLVPGETEAERAAALTENKRLKNEAGYCAKPGCHRDMQAGCYCAAHAEDVA